MPQFEAALRIDRNSAQAHNDLGLALTALGDVKGAVAEYEAALRIDPNYGEARANLESAQESSRGRAPDRPRPLHEYKLPMSDLTSTSWTLTARWEYSRWKGRRWNAVVVIAGEGRRRRATRRLTSDIDLGDAAVIPGLVNAYAPGFVGDAAWRADAGLHRWLKQVIAYRRVRTPGAGARRYSDGPCRMPPVRNDAGRRHLRRRRRAGRGAGGCAAAGGLPQMPRAVERPRAGAWERLDRWLASRTATPTCQPGASPHARHSVRLAGSSSQPPPAAFPSPFTLQNERHPEQELLQFKSGPFVRSARSGRLRSGRAGGRCQPCATTSQRPVAHAYVPH